VTDSGMGSEYDPGGFFTTPLETRDPEVARALRAERARQTEGIELIASENHVSQATLDALASPIVNKTVEGYPGHRYYGGAEFADRIETLARDRARELFGAGYANVQPHSGSQANLAVFLAWLRPGDTVLSMDLGAGGHLSHGSPANISGKWMEVHSYGVDPVTGLIDYDNLVALARRHRPSLIVAGASSYPRVIDSEALASIAGEVGARFMFDMAHVAGLVAGGVHPNPVPHADVVTTTTYKNLRGVRGGLILARDDSHARELNSAVFPGVQGSVILNAVAAKAVCLGEALEPGFAAYARQVLDNARSLARRLMERGVNVVTGGTDTPIVLVDLRPSETTGRQAQEALEEAGLTVNKNTVPGDERRPWVTSGIRLGSSAATARGFGAGEFATIADWVADVLVALERSDPEPVIARVRSEVREMTAQHPMYGDP